MRFRKLSKATPRTPITGRTINDAAEQGEWASRLRGSGPLAMMSTPTGPLLRWAGYVFAVHLVKTTSSISARSGTTAGSGTVAFQHFVKSSGEIVPDGVPDRTAFSFSQGDPIDSGLYGIVLQICGVYWLISVECKPKP